MRSYSSYEMSDFEIGMKIVIIGLKGENKSELTKGKIYAIEVMDTDEYYEGDFPIAVLGDNGKLIWPELCNFEIVPDSIQENSFGFNKETFEKYLETLDDNYPEDRCPDLLYGTKRDFAQGVMIDFIKYLESFVKSPEEIEAISLLEKLGYTVNKDL